MATIVLDPGHGGYDPGACGNGLQEKDITLDIVLKLKSMLEYNGFNVILTRDSDYAPKHLENALVNELQARCDIANNAGADLFMSIHINSGGGEGQEILVQGFGGNAETCADKVLYYLVQEAQWYNRGVKQQNVMVLRDTNMPAILTENGFIDNANDAQKLASEDFRQSLARAHCKGLCDYFNVEFKEQDQQSTPIPVPIPTPQPAPIQEKYVVPTGNNITPLNGGYGWIESLPDQKRIIIHADKYNYISIQSDGIYAYAKDKDSVKLI